jgi:hypothetical protein
MMRLRRASVIAALAVLTSVTTAYAECAWVLWAVGANVALTLSAWPTREECVSDQARNEASYKPKTGETIRLVCLPDTVDPRGPKGGAR